MYIFFLHRFLCSVWVLIPTVKSAYLKVAIDQDTKAQIILLGTGWVPGNSGFWDLHAGVFLGITSWGCKRSGLDRGQGWTPILWSYGDSGPGMALQDCPKLREVGYTFTPAHEPLTGCRWQGLGWGKKGSAWPWTQWFFFKQEQVLEVVSAENLSCQCSQQLRNEHLSPEEGIWVVSYIIH